MPGLGIISENELFMAFQGGVLLGCGIQPDSIKSN